MGRRRRERRTVDGDGVFGTDAGDVPRDRVSDSFVDLYNLLLSLHIQIP